MLCRRGTRRHDIAQPRPQKYHTTKALFMDNRGPFATQYLPSGSVGCGTPWSQIMLRHYLLLLFPAPHIDEIPLFVSELNAQLSLLIASSLKIN